MHISSASPSALFRYAEIGQPLSERLLFESRRLDGALSQFLATCTEYRVGVDSSLAGRLADYSRRSGVSDQWVRRVGQAFLRADGGAVTSGAWRAVAEGQATAARAGAAVRDAAGWLLGAQSRAAGAQARAAFSAVASLATQIALGLGAIARLSGSESFAVCEAPKTREQSFGEGVQRWLGRAGALLSDLIRRVRSTFTPLLHRALSAAGSFFSLVRRLAPTALRTAATVASLLPGPAGVFARVFRFAGGTAAAAGGFLARACAALWSRAAAVGGWLRDGARWLRDRIGDLLCALAASFKLMLRTVVAGVDVLLRVVRTVTPIVVRAVTGALTWVLDTAVGIVTATLSFAWNVLQKIYWNSVSLRLMLLLGGLQLAHRLLGNAGLVVFGAAVLTNPLAAGSVLSLALSFLVPLGLQSGAELVASRNGQPADMLELLHQNFWDLAFSNTDPRLLRLLSGQIEDLQGRLLPDAQKVRPSTLAETPNDDGTLKVSAEDVFGKDAVKGGKLDPWVIQHGEHALISSYRGEQVTMARIGANEYVFGVNGLDLENMGASPNGLVSVIDTAYFDPSGNEYYQVVKQRFSDYLRQVPKYSTLNFAGHSMGAGMLMILLNDPEVQQKIRRQELTIKSVTTYGMVRPVDPTRDDIPPSKAGAGPALFAETRVRHYVDPDDKLAMNVGGSHSKHDSRVAFVDNKTIDDPVAAHTSYGKNPNDRRPDDPQQYVDKYRGEKLPFEVDPEQFKLYWRSGDPTERVP